MSQQANLFALNTRHCRELITGGVFSPQVSQAVFQAATLSLVTVLDANFDYLKRELGIDWNAANDLPSDNSVKSVRNLIGYFRNALAHPYSSKKQEQQDRLFWGTNMLLMNVSFGKVALISIDGQAIRSEYEDDVFVNIGKQGIYLGRHLGEAVKFMEGIVTSHDHFQHSRFWS